LLRILEWMEKHAVDKISVIVDMREFEVMGSGKLNALFIYDKFHEFIH